MVGLGLPVGRLALGACVGCYPVFPDRKSTIFAP